ncbi:amidohydrolase [Actinobacteria bacterium YIM 96077]|uniref:Amidohydrolase n=1 Tax=Phytoactinopolyspora halophila TaxID=1981511 RepID=A0A329QMK8_9ACTN|nr:amidohydrolase [Actinobacteria bacterium YIM 96077]RAW12592.1 amidohydrolase [Phytoactinopolyspora halophila]
MHADLIFTNAAAYTVDPARPWASSVAIHDGRVLDVGGDDLARDLRGPSTEVRDLRGAFVMPGLVDVHVHHALAGKADLYELTFSANAGLAEILDAVRERAAALGPDEWVLGGAWGSTLVETVNRESARRALDEASGGRPVMLSDDSRHNRWVNTRALELAGITADSPDPDGGAIARDPESGEPTGVLLDGASTLAEATVRATGALSAEQHVRCSERAIEMLHSYGVTAFQDAGVSVDILRALKSMDDGGRLDAWVVTSMLINDPLFGFSPIGEELIAVGDRFRSTHHRPDFVKIFLDGVPPTRSAAFLEPYLPDGKHGADYCGSPTMTPDELAGWLRGTARSGLSAKVHCTGDAAVRALLDAVAAVRTEGHVDVQYQVAHGQFVHPEDIPRFAALDVAADISPYIWVPGVIPEAIAGVLPAERAARMQPNRALIDAGALVAGGSDWPVSESPNAWEGIQGLITRQDPTGQHPGTLWAEQAITLAEAIEVFTLNGAVAMGLGTVTGSLRPGKSADLIVTDQNPFEVDPMSIIGTRVTETWFAGRQVFEAG